MMAYSLLNYIQGKNGSRWAQFLRETGTDRMLIVAIDAAKFTHKAMICTLYGDVLVKPFEFDAVTPRFFLFHRYSTELILIKSKEKAHP